MSEINTPRIPMFEVWTTEEYTSFAAKISGEQQFLYLPSDESYSRLIYAAPYTDENIDRLADIVRKICDSKRDDPLTTFD